MTRLNDGPNDFVVERDGEDEMAMEEEERKKNKKKVPSASAWHDSARNAVHANLCFLCSHAAEG